MRPKTMLMRCLLLGSSTILFFSILTGCSKAKEDDWVDSEWHFVNKTNHKIEVQGNTLYSFTLKAGQSHSFEVSTIGSSKVDQTYYLAPYMPGDKIFIDDGDAYIVVANKGVTDITNYKWEKIGCNDYRFTYTFTDEVIADIVK